MNELTSAPPLPCNNCLQEAGSPQPACSCAVHCWLTLALPRLHNERVQEAGSPGPECGRRGGRRRAASSSERRAGGWARGAGAAVFCLQEPGRQCAPHARLLLEMEMHSSLNSSLSVMSISVQLSSAHLPCVLTSAHSFPHLCLALVPQHDEDDGDLAHRLTQIYDRMAEINAASAESRASKILHGLGFTEVMQVGTVIGCVVKVRVEPDVGGV